MVFPHTFSETRKIIYHIFLEFYNFSWTCGKSESEAVNILPMYYNISTFSRSHSLCHKIHPTFHICPWRSYILLPPNHMHLAHVHFWMRCPRFWDQYEHLTVVESVIGIGYLLYNKNNWNGVPPHKLCLYIFAGPWCSRTPIHWHLYLCHSLGGWCPVSLVISINLLILPFCIIKCVTKDPWDSPTTQSGQLKCFHIR